MVQQRAKASRQIILEAAAEVFEELGFSTASIADVLDRAGVSKGKFCYHFPSRDALAAALIELADEAIAGTIERRLDSANSALEGLISASFIIAEMTESDRIVRVGVQLRHGLGHITPGKTKGMQARHAVTSKAIAEAIAQGDLHPDLDPDQVAYVIVVSLRGNLLQSAAAGEDPRLGLATVWPVLLRGLVTEQSADFVRHVLNRLTSDQFQRSATAPAGV